MRNLELCAYQYKRRLEERRGHNYAYWTEELEESLLNKGYRWYNIPKYPNDKTREDVTIAISNETRAKEIVKELRASGHYARIIAGVSQNIQRIKMFSIIYKKKQKTNNIMKIETFKDLKVFVNSLNEYQLNQPVRWLAEDEKRGMLTDAEVLKTPYKDSEGFELKENTPIVKVDC